MCVVYCEVKFSATGRSLVQKSPTECGVSECDRGPHTVDLGPLEMSNNGKNCEEIFNLHTPTVPTHLYNMVYVLEYLLY